MSDVVTVYKIGNGSHRFAMTRLHASHRQMNAPLVLGQRLPVEGDQTTARGGLGRHDSDEAAVGDALLLHDGDTGVEIRVDPARGPGPERHLVVRLKLPDALHLRNDRVHNAAVRATTGTVGRPRRVTTPGRARFTRRKARLSSSVPQASAQCAYGARHPKRPAMQYSSTSRGGTTPAADTPASATSAQPRSKPPTASRYR
jgi:hypothetical protein